MQCEQPMERNLIGTPLAPNVDRTRYREEFLARVGSVRSFQQMFNQLPGVYFCVKDLYSRLIWGNQALFDRLNSSEDRLTGTVDTEYFPSYISDSFVSDDQQVIRTNFPLINRVAVWYNEQRILDWYIKNKFPLYDVSGKVIGLIVSIQKYQGISEAQTPLLDLDRTMKYVREHYRERISVRDLARLSGVSPRHLHRRFQQAFDLGVREFLTKTRIQGAIEALIKTSLPISEIALEFGYCDQSAFTRQFREHTGMTPRRFRRQHSIAPAKV